MENEITVKKETIVKLIEAMTETQRARAVYFAMLESDTKRPLKVRRQIRREFENCREIELDIVFKVLGSQTYANYTIYEIADLAFNQCADRYENPVEVICKVLELLHIRVTE